MKHLKNPSTRKLVIIVIALFGIVSGFLVSQAIAVKQSANETTCRELCVSLTSNGIQPDEIAVKAGEYVQFNSADGKHHNLAEGDGEYHEGHNDAQFHDHVGGLLSGDFGSDEAWRVQFKKAGTYKLHDHYNPALTILVVVYDDTAKPQK